MNGGNGINIAEICQKAVKVAAAGGFTLDYTPDSILTLEQLLDGQSRYAASGEASDKYIWNAAVIFGVYLGQVLLRCRLEECGYSWAAEEDSVPYLKKDEKNAMYPINKVLKRIRNGPEHNVISYYDVSIEIAEGRLKPGSK